MLPAQETLAYSDDLSALPFLPPYYEYHDKTSSPHWLYKQLQCYTHMIITDCKICIISAIIKFYTAAKCRHTIIQMVALSLAKYGYFRLTVSIVAKAPA